MSRQFPQIQKIQFIHLQDHLERCCNVLLVFGFNSGKYDISLIKSYLLLLFDNERGIEPKVMKKANQFVSSEFEKVQLLYTFNILGRTSCLDSFLKAYRTSKTKCYFPHEWFDDPEELINTPYETFFSKLLKTNPLEENFLDLQSLIIVGLISEEGLSQLKLKHSPLTWQENYQYLTSVWQQENRSTFKYFLRWYNNKYVVPTLDAMQKIVDSNHNTGIEILEFGCILQIFANIGLHKSIAAKFCVFTESEKYSMEKIREDMVGGPSMVFTRKAAVDETLTPDSMNWCKSIVGIDVSQLHLFSLCQAMPTGLYKRWELELDCSKFKSISNKRIVFIIWSCHTFNESGHSVRWKVSTRQLPGRKKMHTVLMAFVNTATLCLKRWDAIIIFIHVRKIVLLSPRKELSDALEREN